MLVPTIAKLLVGAMIIYLNVWEKPPSAIYQSRNGYSESVPTIKKRFTLNPFGIKIAEVYCFGECIRQLDRPFLNVFKIL
jgi:hypothetical protein